jgi:hypothetical protein
MPDPRINFKKLRSKISLMYGIDLDETSLAILSILLLETRREIYRTEQATERLIRSATPKGTILQAHPSQPLQQAFWYGMGQWGAGLCLAVATFITIFSLNLKKERDRQYDLIRQLEWYRQYYEKTGQSKTSASARFLKDHPMPEKNNQDE